MKLNFRPLRATASAFTMVEIALCLAIVGFALVAIIGVLPAGLNVQKENREDTILNQDSTVWLDAIRGGGGDNDLLNYVDRIIVTSQNFDSTGNAMGAPVQIVAEPTMPTLGDLKVQLTSGSMIVGLLSTPRFGPPLPGPGSTGAAYTTNNVVAYVRAISGTAAEKPMQENREVRGSAFGYRMVVEVLPPGWVDYSGILTNASDRVLQNNLADVRLLCRWPLKQAFDSSLPLDRPAAGNSRMTFRVQAGGVLPQVESGAAPGVPFYFFQPRQYSP